MKIISWNVNGYRAIMSKNGMSEILYNDPDIICLQETKLVEDFVFDEKIKERYYVFSNPSEDKGRNGVCILSKREPKEIIYKIGASEFDREGRYLEAVFDNYSIVNVYMPHGGRDKLRLDYKLKMAERLLERWKSIINRYVIIAGDFNMARDYLDVARAKANKNNIMFTERERFMINKICHEYIDIYRYKNPNVQMYTWWPYAFNCRQRNIGWRIDYFLINHITGIVAYDINILTQILGSDHCPIELRIGINA